MDWFGDDRNPMDIFEWRKLNPQPNFPSDAAQGWRERLRAFASSRLQSILDEETRLRNQVMTGNPEVGVTAWTVPRPEEVQERARGLDRVEIVHFGDGSYQVRCKPNPEKVHLSEIARGEFAGQDFQGILWALESGLLDYEVLAAASDRVGDVSARSPESDDAAYLAGRFWLCLAHKSYGAGLSARNSYSLCERSLRILEDLHARKPSDPAVDELLEAVKKALWSYDD